MSILVLASDTLIGTAAAGNIEYNGQFYGTDSAASRAQLQRITQGTAVASTSGTSIDFTGIPAWVKKITVMFNGVSGSGSSLYRIRLGAGSLQTTGYVSSGIAIGGVNSLNSSTAGFDFYGGGAATYLLSGFYTFASFGSNIWVASGLAANVTTSQFNSSLAGAVTLAGTLDQIRITTVNGTDTFDAGSINIIYEG